MTGFKPLYMRMMSLKIPSLELGKEEIVAEFYASILSDIIQSLMVMAVLSFVQSHCVKVWFFMYSQD
jgi:hypothetical protein